MDEKFSDYCKDLESRRQLLRLADIATQRYDDAAILMLADRDKDFDPSKQYEQGVEISYQYYNLCIDYNIEGEDREENFELKDIMAVIESLEVVTTDDLIS